MKPVKASDKSERFQGKIEKTGSLLVCIFAVIFMIISIVGVGSLDKSIQMILDHPYSVAMEVNNATNVVSQMRIRMEQLIKYSAKTDFEEADSAIDALAPGLESSVALIEEKSLGPQEDAQRLVALKNQILSAQNALLENPQNFGDNDRIEQSLLNDIYPLYNQFMNQATKIVLHSQNTINHFNIESSFLANNNTVFVVLLTGAIILVSVYFRHAVNRKNRELYYREHLFTQLSDNIDDVIFIVDLEKEKIEFVSPNTGRVLGIEPKLFEEHRDILLSYMKQEDAARLQGMLAAEMLQSTAEIEMEIEDPKSRGRRWIKIKNYPVIAQGEIRRCIVSISDITEAKHAQQALRDALANLNQANEAKRVFLSRMSHEIRTPLNTIIGMSQIASNSLENRERVEDCLYKVAYSSKHLLGIINDVLEISAIESGKFSLKPGQFDFKEMIDSIAALYYTQCRQLGKNFELTLLGVTEEFLIGDALKLNQILLNLLSNAVKFTPEGGDIILSVRQRAVRNGKTHMTFTVKDTGIGIDQAFLKNVFEPFEQNENIANKYGGSGLGMAITKNMVELMGGTISVKSKPGKGTTFVVELFLEVAKSQRKKKAYHNELCDLRVLIVEDDSETSEHARMILKKIGMKGANAASGNEAVEMVLAAREKGEPFDVCLIDWKMPGMDGIETTQKLRQSVSMDELPVILCAYDWRPVEEEARRAGVNAFLSKPMFQSSVYNVLFSTVRKREIVYAQQQEEERFDFSQKHILLVEDNEMNREIMTELLSPTGIKIDQAVNGKEAVELFQNSPPKTYDAILMDVQMPILDGYEATKKIRKIRHADAKTVPILAMTANAFSEDVSASLEAGMNEHLSKPIDLRQLCKILQQYFENRTEKKEE